MVGVLAVLGGGCGDCIVGGGTDGGGRGDSPLALAWFSRCI